MSTGTNLRRQRGKYRDALSQRDEPEPRRVLNIYYPYVSYFGERVPRILDVPGRIRAQNTNALDEVPDSTWFTNRIGRYTMTPEQVRRGPGQNGPETSQPWTLRGTKVGGVSIGFRIKDGRGDTYLLKFDQKGWPELETGAHVVTQRLLWAVGYHVPEDDIIFFEQTQFRLPEDATFKDRFGQKRPLDRKYFEQILNMVDRRDDGSFRGLASKFLPGRPLGGYSQYGTRDDDPNDLVPHQHRRELRGQYVVFSWLNHTDLKKGNWLDMWVQNPTDPSQRYIKHHLIDFGKSLGVMALTNDILHEGFLYTVDLADFFLSAPTWGLWLRPWERIIVPDLPGVGAFDSKAFDPSTWKPRIPFEPFNRRNRFDDFWAAKILMRLSKAHISAAVEAGRYSSAESKRYLTRILVERQLKIARWAFARVNPLDHFRIDTNHRPVLCFVDLWLGYRLGENQPSRAEEGTTYEIAYYDYDGTMIGRDKAIPTREGNTCTSALTPTPRRTDGYTIVSIRTRRPIHPKLAPTHVHLAKNPETGTYRVIGVRRL